MIEADIRYPTDAVLALQGVRALAREGRKLAGLVKGATAQGAGPLAGDGRTVAADLRTIRRRTGEAKPRCSS